MSQTRKRLSLYMTMLIRWYATGSPTGRNPTPHGRSRRDGTRP